MDIGAIWDVIALGPMINILIGLSDILFGSFGLTIIVLTIIIRAVMFPLTRKQMNATKAMQDLQPKLAELQKKHAKDSQKLAAEQMKLYKESGVSPAGCLLPMLVQMPIWIALYQSIMRVLAVAPGNFLNLSEYLYSWPMVFKALPVDSQFLWLNLGTPDFLLALLVGASMWVTQKMSSSASTNPQQKSQAQMMIVMMPLMFVFLSLTFPSGLALYWIISNVITIVIQYMITKSWGSLNVNKYVAMFKGLLPAKKESGKDKKLKERIASVENRKKEDVKTSKAEDTSDNAQVVEEGTDASGREERQDSGGGRTTSFERAKQKPRGSRNKRSKRR
ncbi:MAG: YidC/Oxa1 family membrane protein insertase [Dehalococcoidales bacterium]|nr:YidC/Oxa1 family membrane protein insertase [Dehalococcoidales bacterium]MDD3994681.1 YidC/Oxa1 family membrane protein insertase [Dehalococcoidales bacterium]NLT28146.1 YidC/Oxa1 family membrane protein insertase [Dehalococcoidales bacterium]